MKHTHIIKDIFGVEEKVVLVEIKQERIFDDEVETFPIAIVRHDDGTTSEENPLKMVEI